MTPQEYQFMQHKKTVNYRVEVFLHQSKLSSTCFEIKIKARNIFFMEIKPLIGRRIRIGRRLHVNQP